MTDKIDKIELIRATDLNPGDIVIVKYDETRINSKDVGLWADQFFRGRQLRVACVPKGMAEIQVVSQREAEEKKIKWKEFL